jgi:hypothetical protein
VSIVENASMARLRLVATFRCIQFPLPGETMIQALQSSLHGMGPSQYLLAFFFLASYAYALGGFLGERGRRGAAAGAAAAALGFALLTDPWEHGVLVVAVAVIAMGAFGAGAWLLWALLGWPHADSLVGAARTMSLADEGSDRVAAPPPGWSGPPLLVAMAAMWRPVRPLLRFGPPHP